MLLALWSGFWEWGATESQATPGAGNVVKRRPVFIFPPFEPVNNLHGDEEVLLLQLSDI